MTNIVYVLSLYLLGRSFCSEKSKDISSIVYLIPNRRQYQHSFISSRYVKLIAIRTRGNRHCQRCHHRCASIVTPIIARAFTLSCAFPNLKETKEKKDNRHHRPHHPRRRRRHRHHHRYVYVILVSKVFSDNALVTFGRKEYEKKRQREREKVKKQVFLVFVLIRSTVFPMDFSIFSSQSQFSFPVCYVTTNLKLFLCSFIGLFSAGSLLTRQKRDNRRPREWNGLWETWKTLVFL